MKHLLIASLLFLLTNAVSAAESVGKVILSFGKNTAVSEQGDSRMLKRQSDIYADDLLVTGDKGRLQIRFSDGSRLSLKSGSEFKIAEYSFDQSKPEDGKVIYQLLKGGMRTISGQIGKQNKENYRLETVVATIGIRGTHYGVEYTPEGLFTETIEGAVIVETANDSVVVNAGESVRVFEKTGVMEKGKATGQTGEKTAASSQQSDQEEEQGEQEAQSDSDNQAESSEQNIQQAQSIPAGNTATEGNAVPVIAAPDPTGQGSAAPTGALAAVAFTEIDPVKGLRAGNGAVLVDQSSAVTVDSVGGTGDLVTGVLYIDPNPGSSSEPCAPCSLTGPSNVGSILENQTLTLGQANITWGRWNSGFSLIENGITMNTTGTWHFMYSDSLTTATQLAAVDAVKSGNYLYTFSGGSGKYTSPEIENGKTGALISYNASGAPAGRWYSGTYVVVNWDTQTIDQVSVHAQVDDGMGARDYKLTETVNASTGTWEKTSLNTVLNGGDLKLTGVCSGGGCTVSGNDTTMSGRLTFDLVGDAAQGAVTTYGATGTNPDGDIRTITGTVLLEDGNQAP